MSWFLIILLLITFPACKENSHTQNSDKKRINVLKIIDINDDAGYSNIKIAFNSVNDDTRIHIGEGIYIVDNPIIIKNKGVRIIGSGKDKTFLVPKNVGEPIFEFDADDVKIEGIGLNGEIQGGGGKATFAIFIKPGHKDINIINNKMQDTGASSIIGYSITDCIVDNNIILNSGDDAIKIRGSRIKLVNNIIIRYFDEAIDVAGGENIIVSNNIASLGRIGIVVDDSKNALIYGNIVEDQLQEGIVLGSEEGGIVENNIVLNSVGVAFNLISPFLVNSNIVLGKNNVGFKIHDMEEGMIHNNLIKNSEYGIIISGGKRNLIFLNEYIGIGNYIKFYNGSNEHYMYDNYTKNIKDKFIRRNNLNKYYNNGEIDPIIMKDKRRIYDAKYIIYLSLKKKYDIYQAGNSKNNLNNIDIEGDTEKDKKLAGIIANFLSKNNPGYLSVKIRGNSMSSDISHDLYNSLRGGGQLAVGLVRVPYFIFNNGNPSYSPLWHLFLEKKEVAFVSRKKSEKNVEVYFTENGRVRTSDKILLWKNRTIFRLENIIKKIGNKVF